MIINRLTALRGIGRWTAEWSLMLYFGRTDIFPAGDLALRALVSKYYLDGNQPPERALRDFARDRWGAWASYACVYLFAGLRSGLVTLERTAERTAAARVLSSIRTRRNARADA
jgi:DNA-3-methyladenine glycosylase II